MDVLEVLFSVFNVDVVFVCIGACCPFEIFLVVDVAAVAVVVGLPGVVVEVVCEVVVDVVAAAVRARHSCYGADVGRGLIVLVFDVALDVVVIVFVAVVVVFVVIVSVPFVVVDVFVVASEVVIGRIIFVVVVLFMLWLTWLLLFLVPLLLFFLL